MMANDTSTSAKQLKITQDFRLAKIWVRSAQIRVLDKTPSSERRNDFKKKQGDG